jgi:hypothetical protein
MTAEDDAPAPIGDADDAHAVAAIRDGLVPFHGSAIARDGRGIVLAGPSGTGKSTLAAVAVQFGWSYLADEVAATSPDDLHIRPYHRPIGIRRAGAEALGIELPDLGSVPGDAAPFHVPADARSHTATLVAIVLVRWDRDAVPAVEPVEPAQAMVELMQHLVADDGLDQCFAGVDTLVRRVPTVRVHYVDPTVDGREALDQVSDNS